MSLRCRLKTGIGFVEFSRNQDVRMALYESASTA